MAATVTELLGRYHAGELSIEQLAGQLRGRSWPPRPPVSDAQAYGLADNDPVDDDSWQAVETDPQLSADDYDTLLRAVEG